MQFSKAFLKSCTFHKYLNILNKHSDLNSKNVFKKKNISRNKHGKKCPTVSKKASVKKETVNGNSRSLPAFHAVCSRKKKHVSGCFLHKILSLPGSSTFPVRPKPTNLTMKSITFYLLHLSTRRNSIQKTLGMELPGPIACLF